MAYPQSRYNALQITGLSFSPSVIAWGSSTRCTVTVRNATGRNISRLCAATVAYDGDFDTLAPVLMVYGGPSYDDKAAISWPANTEKTFTFDYTYSHSSGGHEPDLSSYIMDVKQSMMFSCDIPIDFGREEYFDDILHSTDTTFLAVLNALDMPKLSGSIQRCRQGVADDEGEALLASLSLSTAKDTATFLAHNYSMSISATPSVAGLALTATPADVCAGIEDDPDAIEGTFSNGVDYSLVITIGNGYESSTLTLSISRAFANVHLSGASTGGVAFGKFSASTEGNPQFECEYTAHFHAPVLFHAGTNIGDGSFESLNVNTGAGSGTVKIQRYGKMRFLFVDYKPKKAGTWQHISQLDPSDIPSEEIGVAATAYAYSGQGEIYIHTDGKVLMSVNSAPGNGIKGSVAYMVP